MTKLLDYYLGLLTQVSGGNWDSAIVSLQLGLALVAVVLIIYAIAAWPSR